jgi:hypothetical protein
MTGANARAFLTLGIASGRGLRVALSGSSVETVDGPLVSG